MSVAAGRTGAAVAQLDWAIRLFLDHQAYLPAATLAAVAQALLADLEASGPALLELEPGQRGEQDLRELALQRIAGALTLLVRHDRSLPSEGPRFLAWVARRQEAAAGGP